jgi:hypothetical protein
MLNIYFGEIDGDFGKQSQKALDYYEKRKK